MTIGNAKKIRCRGNRIVHFGVDRVRRLLTNGSRQWGCAVLWITLHVLCANQGELAQSISKDI
jgi:hypothetical protein